MYSWAVAPNGQQFMQTGPDRWEAMREPLLPAMRNVEVPVSGAIELPVTNSLDPRSLVGTQVYVGLGRSWDEAKHRAGHYYTVERRLTPVPGADLKGRPSKRAGRLLRALRDGF